MSELPEIVGYVLERYLPGQGPTLTIFTTDPSLGEPVANLIRASDHEKIVGDLNDELLEEKLRRQDAQAKAAGKALRHTAVIRAALAWFDQLGESVQARAGSPAADAMQKVAQALRDTLQVSPGSAGGRTP